MAHRGDRRRATGVPQYDVAFGGTTYIDLSPIGFEFANQAAFGTAVSGSGPDITVTGSESGIRRRRGSPNGVTSKWCLRTT